MSINLGLDPIRALLVHLALTYTRPSVHVAGTNGKGSVTSIVESILLSSNYTVGKYTSPHHLEPRDSISINGCPLPLHTFNALSQQATDANASGNIGASPFELLTAVALCAFEHVKVDIVVLEVGMGGRLDATNVIPDEVVMVSAVTSVDLDHQAFLGSTVRAIAREKAAIVRSGGILVLGDQSEENDGDVSEVAYAMAAEVGARVVRSQRARKRVWEEVSDGPSPSSTFFPITSGTFTVPPPQPITLSQEFSITGHPPNRSDLRALLPLHGDHQLSNVGLAYTIIDVLRTARSVTFGKISDEDIVLGISRVRWPGRLSWLPIPLARMTPGSIPGDVYDDANPSKLVLLVDGAHNAASARTLDAYLSALPSLPAHSVPPPPRTFVISLSQSNTPLKTPFTTLFPLLRPGDNVALVEFSTPIAGMPWVRPVSMDDMKPIVRSLVGQGEIQEAATLWDALRWASRKGSWAVLAGSLYLVADVYRLVGGMDESRGIDNRDVEH